MALNLQDKQAIVAEVNEAAKGALSAVIADSRGVTVDKMTELRKAAREAGVTMRVVRNTLLRRAVEGTDFECLQDTFVGPTLIAFSNEHPGAAARLFKDFAKANDKFEIKGAAFEGKIQDVEFLATLRRSNCTFNGHNERSCGRQTCSHFCGITRQITRSSLIIKRFLLHLTLLILGIDCYVIN